VALVDPAVSARKLARELELWDENAELYRNRGWLMLARKEQSVEVGFVGRVSLGPRSIPIIAACVRFDFENYDLWPPSVEFIDPATGEFAPPPVAAVAVTDEGARNILVEGHPTTRRPFFCIRGTREYHTHPQHTGDDWLLSRAQKAGSLATLCERIYTTMARNIIGLRVVLQTLPEGLAQQAELEVQIPTGDIDELRARAQAAAQLAPVPQHFGAVQ
jgi:hypothetical protein